MPDDDITLEKIERWLGRWESIPMANIKWEVRALDKAMGIIAGQREQIERMMAALKAVKGLHREAFALSDDVEKIGMESPKCYSKIPRKDAK